MYALFNLLKKSNVDCVANCGIGGFAIFLDSTEIDQHRINIVPIQFGFASKQYDITMDYSIAFVREHFIIWLIH